MRRPFRIRTVAALLTTALLVVGCTADGEPTPDEGSPTASPSASQDPSESASPTPSDEPSDEPSASESEEPSETASPTESASPSPSASPSESATPTPTPTPTGSAAALTTTAVGLDADGTAFVKDTSRTSAFTNDGACGVTLAADEDFVDCESADSADGRRTAVVATRTDQGGVDVTVWDLAGSTWTSTLRAMDLPGTIQIALLPGALADDVVIVEIGAGVVEFVTTDAAPGSRVAATLTRVPDVTISYLAGEVIARDFSGGDDAITVYAPPAGSGGFTGTRISGASAGALPENVALSVYAAWVTGDRAAVTGLVAADVERALFDEVPQTQDGFTLDGTSCPVEGAAYVCRFRTRDGQVSTWDLRPVDGVLKVVRLRQNA